MEFSKEIDISGPSITTGAIQQQREPSSMFDMLPESVVQDVILPCIGNPRCHMCERRVYFPVASDDKAYQGTNTADAVCLEEVIRNCTIHDPNENRVGQRRYFLDWSRIEKSHASRHRVIPIPATIERLGLQEIILVQNSPSPPPIDKDVGWIHQKLNPYFPTQQAPAPLSKKEGISTTAAGRGVPLYEDKDRDDELLGQFKFCLRKRPIRSFPDAISNQIFCGNCATRQQELYFEKEFQRITEARDALIEAWFITEHQIITKKARKCRIPPPYYKQQKKNRKQNSKMERRGKFRGR